MLTLTAGYLPVEKKCCEFSIKLLPFTVQELRSKVVESSANANCLFASIYVAFFFAAQCGGLPWAGGSSGVKVTCRGTTTCWTTKRHETGGGGAVAAPGGDSRRYAPRRRCARYRQLCAEGAVRRCGLTVRLCLPLWLSHWSSVISVMSVIWPV